MVTAQLLQRCRAGDATALQTLVEMYQQPVFQLSSSILDDTIEAEDTTQDVFAIVLNALDSYRGDSSFKTWLFSITINACRKRLRKRKARERLNRALQSIFRLSGEGPTHPEEVLIRRETRTALWKAVDALGEKHRLPILLYYEHELSIAEIAKVLDLNSGTVLSRLYTARERIRATMQEDLDRDH